MERESERKAQNTQYVPTKCRVTKPVPPRPATNPLQFVAVKPSPLLIKAQEINKKVEIVKEAHKERKEEAEDWQSNLDNWKSSRRKRQEHIIERVEEVKKLELQEKERNCRRGTTFNEILEKRSKGRFSIPLYDNDANDLSDYGIGSSSSKTNSIKDVDTDDNSSILDEKESSYDEATSPTAVVSSVQQERKEVPRVEQYTYEGAIEDYRTRIRSKISNSVGDAPLFDFVKVEPYRSKECAEAQTLLPKGNLTERRRMFEAQAMNGGLAAQTTKHDDELVNARSIKQRLQSLEKFTETPSPPLEAPALPQASPTVADVLLVGSLKSRLTHFTACDSDTKHTTTKSSPPPADDFPPLDDEEYLTEHAMNGFRPSTSSSDLVAASSSDREDSGIHTADVSCSVSQSDEPVEDGDVGLQQEAPNYRTITESFLRGERAFADRCPDVVVGASEMNAAKHLEETNDIAPVVHSPLVENIAKTIREAPPMDDDDDQAMVEMYENTRLPFTLDSIDMFGAPLAPLKLQPPTEKPPPPPPLPIACCDDDDGSKRNSSPSLRIKKELLIKRSSFLGFEEAAITEQLEQLEMHEKRKEIEEQLVLQHERQLNRQLQLQGQEVLAALPNGNVSETTSKPSDEEIMEKEREIIAMIEQEEKCKNHDVLESKDIRTNANANVKPPSSTPALEPNDIYLGNKKFDEPFYPEPYYDNLSEQDTEVLRVEQELLQLEQEELKRQCDVQLFKERTAKFDPATYENLYYEHAASTKTADTRKSLPDLQQHPDHHQQRQSQIQFRGAPLSLYPLSMPALQHVQPSQRGPGTASQYDLGIPVNHRKSMPDLDRPMHVTPNNNLLMPIQPLKPLEKRDRYISQNPSQLDGYKRGVAKQSMPNTAQLLSKSMPHERVRIQPKAKLQTKSYNQHWLYQEAELRRLADQQKATVIHSRPNNIHHLIEKNGLDSKRFMEPISQQDYVNIPCVGRQQPQAYGHALPMPSYPPALAVEDGRDVMLSVSGRKKCSYCNNELGRGAAMIIESLSLFYHMECFKCCVCHIELGDGLMGTDVRVRNQKLHCHNCYSSDDGIKFSCV